MQCELVMKDRCPFRVALKPRVQRKPGKLIWRDPTTGRTRSRNVAANLTGSTSSTTTAPDGTPSRAMAERTWAIDVPRSTPIVTRFLASSASTHTVPRIASASPVARPCQRSSEAQS